ncbi:hypothetical protein [Roseivirga pacifica]|uniref:hypothetical protein n=1 Tax=Roseivirga pacifica TaxID=1267423 RepID=UPI0020951743|nr:hypothetical protein [Roseivirga pacifica]MCO6360238.1 hypothetical protein [Roseivirga pacifica]MCO6367609.1 hypothetical protein [Roseivirga pacifica]MCO6369859.1 hypothetical protein [Roseivirga pacifica]MCO6375266.1 hypothetical protein [Roseivirga pacifica]MCO6380524.1 hypothetical protein [Roseivirga pacifica]
MDKLKQILIRSYPKGEIRMGGDFCFLDNKGLDELSFPELSSVTKQKFYLGHFFTGLPKFSIIKMVIGFDGNTEDFKWMCNPLFSDNYNSLLQDFNRISSEAKSDLVSDIVELLKLTGANITSINIDDFEFQIWLGETKWRKLSFGKKNKIEIKTTPNNG